MSRGPDGEGDFGFSSGRGGAPVKQADRATQIGGVVGASEHDDGSTVTASSASVTASVGEREHRPVLARPDADRGGGVSPFDQPEP